MSITRIQNNQITDGTIVSYAKLQAGSLTGNLFAPTVTLNSNVTINGNLFLANSGNTATINATNTFVNDPLVVFNNGYTGSLTGYDIGILVNRNLSPLASYGSVNTAWVWSEADQAFEAIATTDTGTGIASINNSGWTNTKVGNSTVVYTQTVGNLVVGGSITLSGSASLGPITASSFQGVIGNVTPATGTFTTIVTGGLQAVAIGNVTPGTAVFTTATTGGLQAVAIGNVTAGTGFFTQIGSTTTANLNTITGASFQGVIGNVTPAAGTFTSITAQTEIVGGLQAVAIGNVTPGTAVFTTQTTGGLQAVAIGNVTPGTAAFTTLSATGASTLNTIVGASFQGVIGNVTPSTATFTTATTGGLQAVAIGNVTPGTGAFTTGTFNTATTGGLQAVAIGNVTPGTAVFTTQTTGGLQAVAIGNVTPGTAAFTTLSATGATTLNTATGASYQGVIGNVTPTTAFFTTANATTVQAATIGNSGAVLYGTLNSASASQTNITAVGTLNGLTVASGYTAVVNGTANNNGTVFSSGALQVAGGAGFASNVYVGGNLVVVGNILANLGNISTVTVTGNSAQFLGNAAGFGALYAGITSGYVYQPQTVIQASTNFNGYAQVNHQNINGGSSASTDFVATMDTGTAGAGYIDMGINSSGYASASATLSYAGDGYVYVQAPASGSLGNLMLGTAAATGNIFFVTGGQNINNQVMTITTSNTVVVTSTVAATSTSTGALQVQGGLGVTGATYAGSVYDAGNRVLTSLSSSGAGNLTVTISAPSSSTIALPSTGPGTAQWGGQTQLPVVAFDAYGRASTASNIALNTIAVTQAGNTANITANATTGLVGFDLTNTTVTAGVYGDTSHVPQVTVDSKGRVTSLSNVAFSSSFTIAGTTGSQSVATGSTLSLAGTYGVTVAVGAEYANISTPQDLRTTASPTFAALTSTGVLISSGNIVAASGTASTNTTTGALVVKGGAGVSGDVNIGGNLSVSGTLTYINTTQEIVSGVEIVAGNLVANSGTASSNTTTGALVVIGGAGISGAINTGGTINAGGNIVAAATTVSTSTTTGALIVAGGVGIAGDTYHGGNITLGGNIAFTSSGNVTLNGGNINLGTAGTPSSIMAPVQTSLYPYSFQGYPNTGIHAITGGLMRFTQNGTDYFAFNTYGPYSLVSHQFIQGSSNTPAIRNGGFNTGFYFPSAGNIGVSMGTGIDTAYFTTAGTSSANIISGAFTVNGGVGINGNVFANAVYDAGSRTVSTSSGSGNLTISANSISLALTGPGSTTVGSSTSIPVITTDQYGRVSSLGTASVSTSFSVGNSTGSTTTVSSGSTLTIAGTYGVTVAVGAEYANIGTPQDLRSTASPTFTGLTAQTISTGGLQAVAIGNVTPGTGAFTTATTSSTFIASGNIVAAASTTSTSATTGALIVPNGGVGISGNLNAGTAGTSIHQLLGNVVIGTGNGPAGALTSLEVNQNNTTPFNSTSTVHIFGQQSAPTKLTLDSVGTSVTSMFIARTAAGTATSPSAVQSGQALGAFIGRGYGATGFLLANVNQSAGMLVKSTQNFTDTAQGTSLLFNVTPNNSNLAVTAVTIGNDGNVLLANSLSVGGYTSLNGVTVNNTAFIYGNLTANTYTTSYGILHVANTTVTSSAVTGAVVIDGGIGISGNINSAGQLFVGAQAQSTVLTSPLAVYRGSSATGPGVQYTQDALINATNTGSSDFIAYANNYPGPSSDHGWMDMGFTSDAFNDPVYTITKTNDGYIFASGANSTVGGNLVISTDYSGSYNDIVIGVGSFYANSEVARFHGNTSNSGYLNLEYTTTASSTSTGALRVQGGVGVAGNIYAGGIQNTPIGSATASTGAFTTLTATSLSLAALNGTVIGNVTPAAATFTTVSTGGLQAVAIGNVTPGTGAFTTGAFSSTLGVTGATTLTTATTGGLQAVAIGNVTPGTAVFTTSTTGGLQAVAIGNVTPGTGAFTTVTASVSANATVANITGTTATTSTTTGALVVAGGTGIAGNLWTGGAATLNASQTSNYDFKVYGNRTTNLLWARPNSTYDTVIIGNTISAGSIVNGAALQIATTDSILLPAGTSAQRPSASGLGTDTVGMIRYSTTSNGLEFYNGTAWQAPSSTITVITDQQFTGTGSTNTFTLSSATTTASTIVSINGVMQIPTLAYSVSGTTLTFTENPSNNDVIDVRVLTTTSSVSELTDISGFNSVQTLAAGSTNSNTAILFTTGLTGGSAISQYSINTDGGFVTLSPNVTVASAGTSVIDNLFANTYSSAKYTITATLAGTNIREINEVLMVHNGGVSGAGTATVMSYGKVNTAGNTLVTFGATTTGNIAQLQATTTNANTIFRIKRDYMAI
jgi:hypothetical protein